MENWTLDRHRFSYSVLAYVYQTYFKFHEVPESIDMDFAIPDCDHFETEIGEVVVQVNVQHEDYLDIFCRRVFMNLRHTPEAFAYFLKWRCSKINYNDRYRFLVMFSIVSSLVVYYFERRCYLLADVAAKCLTDIMISNDLLWKDMSHPVSFSQFASFCALMLVAKNNEIFEDGEVQNTSLEIAFMHCTFPQCVLRPRSLCTVHPTLVEDIFQKEKNMYFGEARFSSISSDQRVSSKFSSCTESECKFGNEKKKKNCVQKVTCERCRIDCRRFLRSFVEKFKSEYGQAIENKCKYNQILNINSNKCQK